MALDNCKKGGKIKSKSKPTKESKEDAKKSKFCKGKAEDKCPVIWDMGGGSQLLTNKQVCSQ